MSRINSKGPLPKDIAKYFWDCDFESLNMHDFSRFIVERLLNMGNSDSIRWLLAHIEKSALKEIVKTSRNLNRKTRNYWTLILE
jgi:hypothetical protein